MKEKRATLITILVLLGIFGSITLFGTLFNLKARIAASNPNHEFYFNGKLYFYSDDDELLGTYECQNTDCGYIKTIIDDDKIGVDYYKEGNIEELKRFDDEYAYIQDGEKIIQYSFINSKVIQEFEAFKNYNTNIDNDIVFFKKDDKWGVFSLKSNMVVKYGFDYIGLKNDYENGVLKSDHFIVLKDGSWSIINDNFTEDSVSIEKPIKTYTKDYIICMDNSVYDYNGVELVSSDRFKKIYTVEDYLIGITEGNLALIYANLQEDYIGFANLGEYSNLIIKLNDNSLEFYNSDTLLQSIALS